MKDGDEKYKEYEAFWRQRFAEDRKISKIMGKFVDDLLEKRPGLKSDPEELAEILLDKRESVEREVRK